MTSITFYVASMSEEGLFYDVRVTANGVWCSCGDPPKIFCSHIEATMVAGERAMVHEDHRDRVDKALALFTGTIERPADWKGAWRQKLKWRGLSTGRIRTSRHIGESGRPVVCFTGNVGVPRIALLRQAAEVGWEAIDSPHSKTTVLVAADPEGNSTKLRFARRHGIPVLAFAEWETLRSDGVFPSADT